MDILFAKELYRFEKLQKLRERIDQKVQKFIDEYSEEVFRRFLTNRMSGFAQDIMGNYIIQHLTGPYMTKDPIIPSNRLDDITDLRHQAANKLKGKISDTGSAQLFDSFEIPEFMTNLADDIADKDDKFWREYSTTPEYSGEKLYLGKEGMEPIPLREMLFRKLWDTCGTRYTLDTGKLDDEGKFSVSNEDKIYVIAALILRYMKVFDSGGHQWAGCFGHYLGHDMHEMYGSPINRTQKTFCSAFYDIDKYFGSYGNFFNFEPIANKEYTCGPPYELENMTKSFHKLEHWLDTLPNIIITCGVPVWDAEGLRILAERHRNYPHLWQYYNTRYERYKDMKYEPIDGTVARMMKKGRVLHHSIYGLNDDVLFYDHYYGNKIDKLSIHLIVFANYKVPKEKVQHISQANTCPSDREDHY